MDCQDKLFTGAFARLMSGLEKTRDGHQVYESDTSKHPATGDIFTRKLHCHESWELKVPLKGRLHCRFENRNVNLGKYSVLLIAPKSIHYATMPADIRHCAIWLNFLFENGDVHLVLTEGLRITHYLLSSDQKSELTTLLGQSANEFCGHISLVIGHEKKKNARQTADKWLSIFFSSMANAIALPSASSPQHKIVSQTIALLNNTFHDATMTINRMAKMLNVSPKYLSFVFNRQTGVTLRQKLIRIRLERALRLLQTGKFSVKEAAAFTGWQNQFYFSNSFRRHYGMAPSKVPICMNQTMVPHHQSLPRTGAGRVYTRVAEALHKPPSSLANSVHS
ncbi:MAG: AraC family transcriptional regulator [Verrucomicrobia bacterium]|nr:AraC family transcriptional regulator [Verrucomicrobiota bacterium]